MFFIFGFGKQTLREYGKTAERQCSRCGKMASLIFVKVTTWFTMFFIPIIPYRTRFLLICPICNAAREIPREEIDEIVQGLRPLNPDESTGSGFHELPEGARDANRFAGKNPTQKAFLEKLEAHERALENEQSDEVATTGDSGETDIRAVPEGSEARRDRELSLTAWEKNLEAREKALEAREKALSTRESGQNNT